MENAVVKLENTIAKLHSSLSNRIYSAEQHAIQAQVDADTAIREAEKAKIPICTGYSEDGGFSYKVYISYFNPETHKMFVFIPSVKSATASPNLNIYGRIYSIQRLSGIDMHSSDSLPCSDFLVANRPVLLLLEETEENGNFAWLVGFNIPPITSGYAVCDSLATTRNKLAPISGYLCSTGSTASIVFTNGNTATAPRMAVGNGTYLPIVDRTGETIAPDAIKVGYVHRFVCEGSKWILMD